MTMDTIDTRAGLRCIVAAASDTVDAGALLHCRVRLETDGLDSSRPWKASILRDDGSQLQAVALDAWFDGHRETPPIALKVPSEAGQYTWTVVVSDGDDACGAGPSAQSTLTFEVLPHRVRVDMREVPDTVVCGTALAFKAHLSCPAGCDLTGLRLQIVDSADRQVGEAVVGAALAGPDGPGHEVQWTVNAPDAPGVHGWRLRAVGPDLGSPHQIAEVEFTCCVVPAPEFDVLIEVFDAETGEPMPDVSVVMHPYRAFSGQDGGARLRVARGVYQIVVMGAGCMPLSREVDISSDFRARAELEPEPPVLPVEAWGVPLRPRATQGG